MGIEEIKKKIREDAEKERERILEEARMKASQIVENGKKAAEKSGQEIISRKEKEAEAEKDRILTTEKLESRKKSLMAKQEVMDKVFSRALEAILNLADYEKLMEHLILSVAEGGEEIVLSPRDESRLSEEFFRRVNARLSEPLKVSEETRDISGGFILKKGNIEINESFDAKMKTLRDEMESKVARVLFSGDNT